MQIISFQGISKIGIYDAEDLEQERALLALTTPPQFLQRKFKQRVCDIARHEQHHMGATPPRKPYPGTQSLRYPDQYHDLTDAPRGWIITSAEAVEQGYGFTNRRPF